MKKFLFLLSFLTLGALTTVHAQTEGKKCSKKSAACCAKKSSVASASATKACCSKSAKIAKTVATNKKACTKSLAKGATCSKKKATAVASAVMTASKAAAADESIEERTCAKSGTVSYYQKSECPMTHKVSYAQVQYSDETGGFMNVSPTAKKECTKANAASCKKGAKAAKVVKTSAKE